MRGFTRTCRVLSTQDATGLKSASPLVAGSHACPNDGTTIMRFPLVGPRHFGVTTFDMLRKHGVEIVRIVVADADDRLAAAARTAGIEVVVQVNPKLVVAKEIAEATDLI